MAAGTDLLFSPVFHRHPNLRVALVQPPHVLPAHPLSLLLQPTETAGT